MSDSTPLPALPGTDYSPGATLRYTERQLLAYAQDYARAAVAEAVQAERERCAKLCDEMGAATWWPNEARDMADILAAAIRATPAKTDTEGNP